MSPWRNMFGPILCVVLLMVPLAGVSAEDMMIRPLPAPGPVDNPLKGWCPYTDAGTIYQPYSMVFQYVPWNQLEPVENQFHFEEWEKSWDVGLAQNKHIIFRVYIDYPEKPSGLPEWLREAGVKETAYKDYGGGKSPDYDDPRMVAAMERLIAAIGKRYNHHPRIAFIQLGLLGFWGEWHTYPRTKLYASSDTERRIIEAYRRALPEKSLMVRYATGYAGEQEWIGFHDDMFPEDTDNGKDWSFLSGIRKSGRTENWRNAVIGGEMVPDKAPRWLGDKFDTTVEMLQRSHFTWVGPYCPALEPPKDQSFLSRSQELVRQMGYEYCISEIRLPAEVKNGQSIRLSFKGRNLGVAPFYYPWSVEWALLDAAGEQIMLHKTSWDVRTWQPGEFSEETELRMNVPTGTYRLGIGIRDPWKDRPAIRFANDLPVVNGWTLLSEVRVTDPNPTSARP